MNNVEHVDAPASGAAPEEPGLPSGIMPPLVPGGDLAGLPDNGAIPQLVLPGTPDAPPAFLLSAPGEQSFTGTNPHPLSLDAMPFLTEDGGEMMYEAATADEWRALIQQGPSLSDFNANPGQYAAGGLGADGMLSGLSGTIAEQAGVNGAFVIEMPRLGTIDGYVQVEPGHTNIWLSPRQAVTRALLMRNRGEVERDASRHAGVDINLMIV